jgi:hypothetical protein
MMEGRQMTSTPRPAGHEQALARRAEEVRQQVLSDEEFMRQGSPPSPAVSVGCHFATLSRVTIRATAVYEAAIIGRAREQWSRLNAADQEEVRRLIQLIELDPRIDGVHKFVIAVEDIAFTVYNNGIWQIAYSIVDNASIEVTGIARVGGPSGPHLRL